MFTGTRAQVLPLSARNRNQGHFKACFKKVLDIVELVCQLLQSHYYLEG